MGIVLSESGHIWICGTVRKFGNGHAPNLVVRFCVNHNGPQLISIRFPHFPKQSTSSKGTSSLNGNSLS